MHVLALSSRHGIPAVDFRLHNQDWLQLHLRRMLKRSALNRRCPKFTTELHMRWPHHTRDNSSTVVQ